MVRAKAKEVVQRIGAIMRPSQRPNVRGLSVRAAFALKSDAAHLAAIIVHVLNMLAQLGVANDPKNRRLNSLRLP